MEEANFLYDGKKVLYFKDLGGKRSILLMHGYNFNSHVWEEMGLVKTLKALDYNVYAIDMPDFPNSSNRFYISEPSFFRMLVFFIDNVVKDKPVILGSSVSGYLALRFAENYENKIDSLIVVGPVKLDQLNLKEINAKILGIWGSDDEDPSKGARLLRQAQNATTRTIDGAKHACYLDKPDEFNRIVRNFLYSN